ncbi:hypothetical protein DYB36_013047 [Aphanomyces astaci]|uniref:Amino acid transporter transmembrane domain-containing protein n=1 Tax=Aphanomyces astaci TaxID=112090 RepID=A0A397A351_APHAT|nr:hypothetical protein DYB36_013047 [Aphanomyces astaci]
MTDVEMQSYLLKEGTSVQSIDYDNATVMGVRPYGRVIALAMTLNCMIGTGCFGLPFAFASAGISLTSLLLLLGTVGSLVTMNYTLEAMARAEGLSSTHHPAHHRLTYRRHNFSCIGHLFAGQTGYTIVQIPLVLYSFGCLWSFASIFASSCASMFYTYVVVGDTCNAYAFDATSGCTAAYLASMFVFSILVVGLVLMEMGDQARIQKFLTIYRIVALSLMVGTMSFKLYVDGWDAIQARLLARDVRTTSSFAHFSLAFGSTILALNCHHNMPDIMQPLSSKQHARQVVFAAMVIGCVFYFLVGILGALAFDHVNPLASLMWSDFTGCGNGWHPCSSSSVPGKPPTSTWLGSTVHIIVIMFPVVNILSSYPMCGLTLASNLLSALPKSVTAPLGPSSAVQVARMLAVLPTLVLAAVFKNLDDIFTVTGLFGFVIGLVVPCWFQVVGISACRRFAHDQPSHTPYTIPCLSSVATATVVLSVMLLATAVATVSILVQR